MNYEARKYEVVTSLDGIPCTIRVRVFVKDGRIRALRSLHLIDWQDQVVHPFHSGTATEEELATVPEPGEETRQ